MYDYYDFAENDRTFLEQAKESGIEGNAICFVAQNCCEKYLKQIVSDFVPSRKENSRADRAERDELLNQSHSLKKILNYMFSKMGEVPDVETRNALLQIDGYYIDSRYPSGNAFMCTKEDIDICYKAVDRCYNYVNEFLHRNELQFEQEETEMEIY